MNALQTRETRETRQTCPRLILPYTAREIPGEDGHERATHQTRKRDRIPKLTQRSAQDDLREAGAR